MASTITVIVGPTASGKSGMALLLAEKTGGVIINADSQQVYSDLRVLTARPSAEEEARIPHKLYGFLPATERCSAGKWLRFAVMEINWALSMGMHPIVVGGTGLYIKALVQGIAQIPAIDDAVRLQAENDYHHMGKEAFCQRLRAVDPLFFERLKVYDRQRLVRAYSVWLGSGKSLSHWQAQTTPSPYPREQINIIPCMPEREKLYAQCDARFSTMIEQGALKEVESLLTQQLADDLPIMKTIGIKELGSYLAGGCSFESAIAQAQQATRNYAKRQFTWFRNQKI